MFCLFPLFAFALFVLLFSPYLLSPFLFCFFPLFAFALFVLPFPLICFRLICFAFSLICFRLNFIYMSFPLKLHFKFNVAYGKFQFEFSIAPIRLTIFAYLCCRFSLFEHLGFCFPSKFFYRPLYSNRLVSHAFKLSKTYRLIYCRISLLKKFAAF